MARSMPPHAGKRCSLQRQRLHWHEEPRPIGVASHHRQAIRTLFLHRWLPIGSPLRIVKCFVPSAVISSSMKVETMFLCRADQFASSEPGRTVALLLKVYLPDGMLRACRSRRMGRQPLHGQPFAPGTGDTATVFPTPAPAFGVLSSSTPTTFSFCFLLTFVFH